MSRQRATPENFTLRYQVTFGLLDGTTRVYTVATLHGEAKAVVLATRQHHGMPSPGHVVAAEVLPLPGEKPASTDLIDRYEW